MYSCIHASCRLGLYHMEPFATLSLIYIYTYINTYIHIRIHIWITSIRPVSYASLCAYMHIYVYVYTLVYMYMYIHIYKFRVRAYALLG